MVSLSEIRIRGRFSELITLEVTDSLVGRHPKNTVKPQNMRIRAAQPAPSWVPTQM